MPLKANLFVSKCIVISQKNCKTMGNDCINFACKNRVLTPARVVLAFFNIVLAVLTLGSLHAP